VIQSIEKLAELDVENLYPGHELYVEGEGKEHMAMVLESIRRKRTYGYGAGKY